MSIREAALDTALFKSNPNLFIEKVIKEYVAHSPVNRLVEYEDAPLWEEPIVAFADGDDPIFETYKTIIHEFHMTPREALEKYIQLKGWNYGFKERTPVSVISYVLPIAIGTLDAERDSPYGGCRRYNHFRWLGEVFWRNLENYLASIIELMGHHAFAPGRSIFFQRKDELAIGPRVNWSERHVAYAAGLGTFGLNGLLITSKGCAHFVESVVCDLALTPTTRPYDNHQAYCPFFKDKSCRQCIDRCKAGAITENGRDVLVCKKWLGHHQRVKLKEAGLDEGYIGKAATCGQCMTNVPCEDRKP
jgi:epoxyqueuosine reductase